MWRYTRLAGLFIAVHVGSAPFPTLQWSFPHDSHFYKLSCSKVAGQGPPLLPSASLFIYSSVRDFPSPPLWCSGRPALFATCLLLLLFILFVFFLFFPWEGSQSVQGAMLIWPRVVCGSTTCHLALLVVCFSQAGRNWHLVVQEPSWFLHLTWSGDAMHRLVVWRCQSFASSWCFFLQDVSPVSLQDFTLGSTLSASSL
jgi:hypothetical protein